MKALSRQSVQLLLLALVFIAPGLAAIYFYQHPQWLSQHTTNKGKLLSQPILIRKLTSQAGLTNTPQWHLVVWRATNCNDECLKSLDQLTQVRLALGRHYYEVSEVLLMPKGQTPLPMPLLAKLREKSIQVVDVEGTALNTLLRDSEQQSIYIANPQGYIVLQFEAPLKVDNVYHDMKQLLTTTQTKSS
jgi:hypothetical protein